MKLILFIVMSLFLMDCSLFPEYGTFTLVNNSPKQDFKIFEIYIIQTNYESPNFTYQAYNYHDKDFEISNLLTRPLDIGDIKIIKLPLFQPFFITYWCGTTNNGVFSNNLYWKETWTIKFDLFSKESSIIYNN